MAKLAERRLLKAKSRREISKPAPMAKAASAQSECVTVRRSKFVPFLDCGQVVLKQFQDNFRYDERMQFFVAGT